MKQFPLVAALSLSLALGLSACSLGSEKQSAGNLAANMNGDASTPALPPTATNATQPPRSPAPSASPPHAQADKVISLEGLGDLRLGQAVSKSGSWAERGAQTGDACRTVSSPDYPGVYAMVIDGKVRRITIGQRSDVKLAERVGVGATESDVKKWFGGFRSEPHKYEDAPAKYLTAPNAASGDPAVRFEIGQDDKVKMIHIGMMPQLAYVEGCA